MKPTEAPENGTGIHPDCRKCVLTHADAAARFSELNEQETRSVLELTQCAIEQSQREPILVQQIYRTIADKITELKGNGTDWDAYRSVKQLSNQLALDNVKLFETIVRNSEEQLITGLHLAAAGNTIDYGAQANGNVDIAEALGSLMSARFERFDISALTAILEHATRLLYLCDNCGEIGCDKVFIKMLKTIYPNLHVTMAFRDRPIINDATLDDVATAGIHEVAETLSSGSVYPGTILNETSDAFKQQFESADLIIAKGQGNFESLLPDADQRMFFLLRIKCDYMAKLAQVSKDVDNQQGIVNGTILTF